MFGLVHSLNKSVAGLLLAIARVCVYVFLAFVMIPVAVAIYVFARLLYVPGSSDDLCKLGCMIANQLDKRQDLSDAATSSPPTRRRASSNHF